MLKAILMTAIVCAAMPAFAQDMTAEQRTACMGDYERYCKGTMPGGGRIIACLNKNPISEGCKKVLAARKN